MSLFVLFKLIFVFVYGGFLGVCCVGFFLYFAFVVCVLFVGCA